MRLLRDRATPLAAIGLALLAAACVSPDEPGVGVTEVQADLVFGLEEEEVEPAAPANTAAGPVDPEGQQAAIDVTSFPAFRNPAADRLPPLKPVAQPSTCPKAPPTAAADRPAEAEITGAVQEGVYRWKRQGVQRTAMPDGEVVESEISGFEKRIVRNVEPVDDAFDPDAYTFEVVQVLIDRPVVQVTKYLVKPNSEAQVAPGGAFVVDEPRGGEPERGVSIVGIEQFDEDDRRIASSSFSSGLLLIGLPVDPGEPFQSASTDPRTGQTIVHDGQVKGRVRIDACGDLVDGWRVEATQRRSDQPGEVVYNYIIATQYGGLPILEEIHTNAPDGTGLEVTFTLGQLEPDPLPEGQ